MSKYIYIFIPIFFRQTLSLHCLFINFPTYQFSTSRNYHIENKSDPHSSIPELIPVYWAGISYLKCTGE